MSDTTTVIIPERFIGPPGSAHGGYACGVVARALTEGPAEATLKMPPPVDRPLRAEVGDERSALYDGDTMVAEARPCELELDVPGPVGIDAAETAARAFDVDQYRSDHWFPECFACGPARAEGDGLRLFPAPIERPDPVVAWPWTPDPSTATSDDGLVDPLIVWAALDCPSGLAWSLDDAATAPHVLGRMRTAIERRPAPGDRLVAAGWIIGSEGRKRLSGSVLWDDRGLIVAAGLATWIVLNEDQVKAFGAAGGR